MNRLIRSLIVVFFVMVTCAPVIARLDDRDTDNSPVAVNFQTQIWPVLQRKCLECHNSSLFEAGLNLESKKLAEAGGHTGNTILGTDPLESELFQRIISDDESYRMPRDAKPLSQAEIEVFREWIAQGSDWPELLAEGESSLGGLTARYFHRYVDPIREAIDRDGKLVQFLGFPLVAFLLFMVVIERIKKSRAKRIAPSVTASESRNKKGLERIGYSHYVAVLMTFVAIGFGMFHFGAAKNTQLQIEQLELEIAALRGERAEGNYGPTTTRPRPPRPRHPKRLGGIYYRGNDERSPKLFNGGFYRTADLEVWLSDSDGNRLEYQDSVTDDSLFVSTQITRAPMATSALFTPRVMSAIYLSRQVPDEDAAELKDAPLGFIAIEEGERWLAHYPIATAARSLEAPLQGMIYLYQGKLDGNRVSGKIHYGIEFEIVLQEGKISSDSQIWMGSIFNFGRGLLIPADDRITLSEWFDFRPIPEIEGENSTDPELLGIPEHVPAANVPASEEK